MSGIVNLLPINRSERVGYAKIGINYLPRLYTRRSYYDDLLCNVPCENHSAVRCLSYRHVHRHFDLHVFYGMVENFVVLNIRNRLIFVFIIFVIAVAYENFWLTKISRTTVLCSNCSVFIPKMCMPIVKDWL